MDLIDNWDLRTAIWLIQTDHRRSDFSRDLEASIIIAVATEVAPTKRLDGVGRSDFNHDPVAPITIAVATEVAPTGNRVFTVRIAPPGPPRFAPYNRAPKPSSVRGTHRCAGRNVACTTARRPPSARRYFQRFHGRGHWPLPGDRSY